jgi:hypothetical protein
VSDETCTRFRSSRTLLMRKIAGAWLCPDHGEILGWFASAAGASGEANIGLVLETFGPTQNLA